MLGKLPTRKAEITRFSSLYMTPRGAVSALWSGKVRLEIASGLTGACLDFSSALEIERRPRGASLASQLPHLLQRTYVCKAMVVRLVCTTRYRVEPNSLPTMERHETKAGNSDPTGHGALQQMWELACQRCAARAALDLEGAGKTPACASRCAARAALDLEGARKTPTCTSRCTAIHPQQASPTNTPIPF